MAQTNFRPSISVRDVPMIQTGPGSASLQFDSRVLANLPKVAIICPTGNRGHLWPLMKHNMLKQSYPHHLMHWVIVDDGAADPVLDEKINEFAKTWPGTVKLERLTLPQRLILGRKRNLMCELGFAIPDVDIVVHMDDDDLYHRESVKVRVALLEMYRSEGIECVGCTQVNCYDVVTDTAFNAFDPCHAGKPSGFSESTTAYTRAFWEERKWPDEARNAEGHHFMLGRWNKAMNIPSNFVICQLTHDNNTIVRRTYAQNETVGPDGKKLSYRETNMDPEEKQTVDEVHEAILMRNPNERLAKAFLELTKNETESEKILDIYNKTPYGVESAHRFKVFRRAKMTIDHFSHLNHGQGIRIAYVCPPTSNPLPWSAFERCANWGGSEEAVKHITRYFVNQLNARVVVFSNWSKELITSSGNIVDLKKYGRIDPETGVCWKPYDLWNSMDEADLTIVWRDPGSLDAFRVPGHRSGKTCLDVHDQLQVFVSSALSPVDFIMVKSEHHRNTCIPPEHHSKCIIIPNGFDPNILSCNEQKSTDQRKYYFINTSRPDRGMSCLMDVTRDFVKTSDNKKFRTKKCAWAYGFQDMPDGLVQIWNSRRSSVTSNLDILEKLSEEAVSNLYNDGKYFLYFSRFVETDCISLTKAMYYGSFPLVAKIGAVGEKIERYIRWLDSKGASYKNIRRPVLYQIPADRFTPDGLGPVELRHPNDSSSGLYDSRLHDFIDSEISKPLNSDDLRAMREFVMDTFTWNSIAEAWSSNVFGKVHELIDERRVLKYCNDILNDLQNNGPEFQNIFMNRRIVLVNPEYENDDDRRITEIVVKGHQRVAWVIHTLNNKSLENYIYQKFSLELIEGLTMNPNRKVLVAQGCGLVGLSKRLKENKRDLTIIEL